ncbi:MAG TPA: plastocyanin/azurin family copper-binding protein [Candidatus Cybelea sp.]|jgi:plastocyanin
MSTRLAALTLALAAAIIAGCAGGSTGTNASGANTMLLPSYDKSVAITATLPNTLPQDTVGEELPSEGLGTINDPHWKATLGGFTQTNYSQALGFPTGTTITLENLSKTISHTLNVVKKIKHGPAKFPTSPSLPTTARGNGILSAKYASGVLSPGKSVTIKLTKAGFYLFGCAFHYGAGMRDVFVVKAHATPGPEATPPAQ